MSYCQDCGCRMSGGICSNCHEELYIYENQHEYLPDKLSDDFANKVNDQYKKTKKLRKEYYKNKEDK